LKNPAATAAIVGVRSAHQSQGVVGAENLDLTRDEIAEIEDRFVPEPA
jgi:aryl-alcohol dehydrogenase-like predicted oxidoreductase